MPDSRNVAAIDCGTNSTRLLVGHLGPDGRFVTVDRMMRITRLGEGVDANGRLSDPAIDRTKTVLDEFRTVMDRNGVAAEDVRITATAAARDAVNRDDWFDNAEASVGVRPELLSGEAEAELSFTGATADMPANRGPFLVFDLGGGSTEFAFGGDKIEGAISLPIGCVRLTERFIESDPPHPQDLISAISYAATWIDEVTREIPGAGSAKTVLGLAGTVSTAAAVEIGLAAYDRDQIHHFTLTRAAAEDVFRTLVTESYDDRLHNPGLEEGRCEVIVGGMCALVAIYRTLGVDEVLVSESDILDGLAMSVISGWGADGG